MELKVADQAWIAAALLHKDNPERPDFSVDEIKKMAEKEFGRPLRPGVYQHIVNHGLAQAPATPAALRLFTQTGRGRRRLFRSGDEENPQRRSGKVHPEQNDLPDRYKALVQWYESKYSQRPGEVKKRSPNAWLAFVGLIPAYDLQIMTDVIKADCERVEDETQ